MSAEIKLDSFAGNAQALQGLAVHTPTGFLHTIDTEKNQLVVFDSKGRMLAQHSLSHTNVRQAHGMVFAPSGDTTDAADTLSLFVVDRQLGGAIVELAWDVAAAGFRFMGALPMAGQGTDVAAALVRSIDTASFSPPSPDPAGIVYLEASSTFMISDSEVNEMANLFTGDNMFEMNLAGDLIATSSSMAYTKEPAGVTLNTSNGHLFIADDNRDEIFEVAAGPDNIYGSSDDVVTKFDTRAFGSYDPEGLSYDTVQQRLFIADGLNAQVYTLTPGLNGVFDGVPPDGDDQYSSFDTAAMGITDPEGIAFDPDSSTLYVVGEPTTVLAQMTVSGQLLRLIDISAPNPSPMIPAGLAIAPSSENPTQNNIYVADRRYDNDFDPSENDGKVYEFSIPPISAGNTPPVVSAGGDQNVVMPNSIALNATVTDDGLPNPPSTLVTNWTLASGDGTATFADPSQVNTTVSFSNAGTYVLRLEATDGELTSSDEMSCVVTSTNETVFQVRVAAAADDVEQTDTGKMLFTSTDLDMAVDKVKWGEQTIGMRFLGVEIPADAIVTDAYIQFQTDEVHTDPVELNVVGELAANSAGFINIRHNVSDRSQTANSVNWSPLAWETIGEAGIAQRTPDLSAVIQEIVTAPGWTPGNAMTFIVTGTGKRSAEAYEGTQTGAPLLRVVFHTP